MKTTGLIRTAATAAAFMLLATACVEHDEVEFEGTVVGIRNCSSIMFDPNSGFIVQLTKPEGVGGTMVSEEGETMENLAVLYEGDKQLRYLDKVRGTMYWDDKYSRANCSVNMNLELPEAVIVKVTVEK